MSRPVPPFPGSVQVAGGSSNAHLLTPKKTWGSNTGIMSPSSDPGQGPLHTHFFPALGKQTPGGKPSQPARLARISRSRWTNPKETSGNSASESSGRERSRSGGKHEDYEEEDFDTMWEQASRANMAVSEDQEAVGFPQVNQSAAED